MKQINSKLVNFAEDLDKLECFSSFIINYLIIINHLLRFLSFFELGNIIVEYQHVTLVHSETSPGGDHLCVWCDQVSRQVLHGGCLGDVTPHTGINGTHLHLNEDSVKEVTGGICAPRLVCGFVHTWML